MASIKIKFRPSSVGGKDGSLFFQIIHLRQVRQLNTGLHVGGSEWDAEEASVIVPAGTHPERIKYLFAVKENLEERYGKLRSVILWLDNSGKAYTADDVVAALSLIHI